MYRLFRKTVKSGNKTIKKWYYYFKNSDGKTVQKVCSGCLTKADAERFIAALPAQEKKSETTVYEIAKNMYVPGSDHVKRREQLGKSVQPQTLIAWRRYLRVIVEQFGSWKIADLSVREFMCFVMQLDKSTSWKNHCIQVMTEIYEEAVWQGQLITVPTLQNIKNRYKKADVLTGDEIIKFINPDNFDNETEYVLFLLTLSAGLRISEASGFRACQLSDIHNVVYVDGFLNRQTHERNNYCKAGTEDNPHWRVAIIPQKTATELRRYIFDTGKAPDDLLFTHDEECYKNEHLLKIFKRAIKKAGIEPGSRKLTCHSLRYTYVTRMRQFYDADTVRKMAGHTTQKMNDYYNRPTLMQSEQSLLSVIDKAAAFF